jgi:hypothetical protein
LGRCAIDGAYRLATALECAEERTEAQQRQVDRLPRHADVAPAEHLTSVSLGERALRGTCWPAMAVECTTARHHNGMPPKSISDHGQTRAAQIEPARRFAPTDEMVT